MSWRSLGTYIPLGSVISKSVTVILVSKADNRSHRGPDLVVCWFDTCVVQLTPQLYEMGPDSIEGWGKLKQR